MFRFLSFLKGKLLAAFLVGIFLILLQSALGFVAPFLLQNILDSFKEIGNPTANTSPAELNSLIALNIGLSIAAMLGSLLFSAIAVVIVVRASVKFIAEIRAKMFQKIQDMSQQDIDKVTTSSLITRITTDSILIEGALAFGGRFLARGFFMFLGGIISCIILSPDLSWILLGIVPIILIVVAVLFVTGQKWFKKLQPDLDAVNKSMRQNILGVRVVKSFSLHEKEKEDFKVVNKDLTFTSRRAYTSLGIISPIVTLIFQVSTLAVVWIGGSPLLSGNKAILIQILPFIQVLQQVLFGMLMSVMVFVQLGRGIPSAKRIVEVLDQNSSIKYGEKDENWNEGIIEFKDVNFSYSKNASNILKNLNFKIRPNEKVGFVGRTGSGKSTLANLFTRSYDVSSGNILINGNNIKDFSRHSINKNVSIATQQVSIFSGSIRSNIAFGLEEENNEEKIEKAAKIASAWEFISKQEKGLDARVEQRGTNFSGGQKQRIALARTIAKKANLFILDESTSALDNFTEKEIKENISKNFEAAMVVISQKINSVKDSDTIYVLDEGEIITSGTHIDLLKNNQFYYDTAVFQLGQKEVDDTLAKEGGF